MTQTNAQTILPPPHTLQQRVPVDENGVGLVVADELFEVALDGGEGVFDFTVGGDGVGAEHLFLLVFSVLGCF